MADSAEFSEESAQRLVLLTLWAVIAFVFAAAVAVAVTRSDNAGSSAEGDSGGLAPASDALVGTGVGPLPGTDIATYEAGRARALAEARGRWTAVVSLRSYATEADVRSTFAGVSPPALLVAAAGGEPAVITGSVADWTAKARADAVEERKNLQAMAATADDKSFRDQFNADADRLTRLLTRLDPAQPVVFGLVVTASADGLRAFAARPEVRLVDLVSRAVPDRLDQLHGLRPEETTKAADPRTRPL